MTFVSSNGIPSTNICCSKKWLLCFFVSQVYEAEPYRVNISGRDYVMKYVPGESDNVMFGGNSNWKGPIWLCSKFS